jgi:beta-phosphoglucomutase-like phosphatase (HAD superfamily)
MGFLESMKKWLKEAFGVEATDEQIKAFVIDNTEEEQKEEKKEESKEEQKEEKKEENTKEDNKGESQEESKVDNKELEQKLADLEKKLKEKEEQERLHKLKELAKGSVDEDLVVELIVKNAEQGKEQDYLDKLKKEKVFLFNKASNNKGFNPAGEVETLTGVEKAFYDRNPDLKPAE